MKIGHIIVPTDDMDAQIAFYQELGLTVHFRDGDRYAGVTDGQTTLGLADPSQQPEEGSVVVSFQVESLDAALERIAKSGSAVAAAVTGPHERRATVVDPSGNPIVIYERLP